MLSAAQRQKKLARKAKARKAKAAWLDLSVEHIPMIQLLLDKLEELYGPGNEGGYTEEQVAHATAIIDSYTPDEFDTALALSDELSWGPDGPDDLAEDLLARRAEQRRQQGRGL